uniref:Uncharacterized protein n=1 Tax=Mustela putorius furo TaxID=9669 RepID=M3XWN2_MUSPF
MMCRNRDSKLISGRAPADPSTPFGTCGRGARGALRSEEGGRCGAIPGLASTRDGRGQQRTAVHPPRTLHPRPAWGRSPAFVPRLNAAPPRRGSGPSRVSCPCRWQIKMEAPSILASV